MTAVMAMMAVMDVTVLSAANSTKPARQRRCSGAETVFPLRSILEK